MLSLPVFISSAFCRAQVTIETKKHISKTTLIYKYTNQEAINYIRGVGSFLLTINTEGPKIQGGRFKSGHLIMSTNVTGLSLKQGWPDQGTPAVAV